MLAMWQTHGDNGSEDTHDNHSANGHAAEVPHTSAGNHDVHAADNSSHGDDHGSHHDDAVNHGGHGDSPHTGHDDSTGNHDAHGDSSHAGHHGSHGSHNDHGNSPHAGHHGAGSHDGHGHCSIGHLLSMVFLDTDSTTDFPERSIADFYVTEPVDRLFVIRRYAQAPRGPPLA